RRWASAVSCAGSSCSFLGHVLTGGKAFDAVGVGDGPGGLESVLEGGDGHHVELVGHVAEHLLAVPAGSQEVLGPGLAGADHLLPDPADGADGAVGGDGAGAG